MILNHVTDEFTIPDSGLSTFRIPTILVGLDVTGTLPGKFHPRGIFLDGQYPFVLG